MNLKELPSRTGRMLAEFLGKKEELAITLVAVGLLFGGCSQNPETLSSYNPNEVNTALAAFDQSLDNQTLSKDLSYSMVIPSGFILTTETLAGLNLPEGAVPLLGSASEVIAVAVPAVGLSIGLDPGVVQNAFEPQEVPMFNSEGELIGWHQLTDIDAALVRQGFIKNLAVASDPNQLTQALAEVNEDTVKQPHSQSLDPKPTPESPQSDEDKLSSKQKKINDLLRNNPTAIDDFLDMKANNDMARTADGKNNPNPKETNQDPEVKELLPAIVVPKENSEDNTVRVFTGDWNQVHGNIARDNGVPDPLDNSPLPYISSVKVTFTDAEEVPILILYKAQANDLTPELLAQLEAEGYVVMGPNYTWLVPNASASNGYYEVPSPLSVQNNHISESPWQ